MRSLLLSSLLLLSIPATVSSETNTVKRTLSLPIPEPLDVSIDDFAIAEGDLIDKSFRELQELREDQSKELDQLILDGKVRENPRGTIDLLTILKPEQLGLVKSENRIRLKVFEMIGVQESRPSLSIGREFHRHRTKVMNLPTLATEQPKAINRVTKGDVPTSLTMSISPSLYGPLGDQLAKGFLGFVGYGEVEVANTNSSTRYLGKRSFGNGYLAIRSVANAPDKNTENTAIVTMESGRLAGTIPSGIIALEGLAIVTHPENPITRLTMAQVADIFSGEITTWDRVSSSAKGSVTAITPDKGGPLYKMFENLVLAPYQRESGTGVTHSAKALSQLLRIPSAITVCRINEIPEGAKALRIRAADSTVSQAPTRANVISLDYPFIQYTRISSIGEPNEFTAAFAEFASHSLGQSIFKEAGFSGIDWQPTEQEERWLAEHRDALLGAKWIPSSYKYLIRDADRFNSPFNIRFVPKTKTFELTNFSKVQLKTLETYLTKGTGKDRKVILVGFADSQGNDEVNRSYSKKRAESVAARLRAKGITNIYTQGIGEDVPVGNNATTNGRAANRRVEVWLQ